MSTRLRILAPILPRVASSASHGMAGLFWCGVAATIVQLTFSSNVLAALGHKPNVHPATIFMALCVIYGTVTGAIPWHKRLRDAPGLMLFVVGIPLVMAYSIYWVGISGATVFVESFWSAGLLALLLEPGNARQKRILGYILIALVILNVVLALYESLTHTELFPLTFDPDALDAQDAVTDDFRAHALFVHPLSASLVTAMAFFLLYSSRIRFLYAAPIFGFLLIGLLAYGGRTALGITVVVSAVTAGFMLLTSLVKRRPNMDLMKAVALAAIIIPPIVYVVVTETTIADRIINNLYYDDSAAVRATQWDVFSYLTVHDWLFGVSKLHLTELKYQIGLGGNSTDIENFWILIFLALGIPGFMMFLAVFGAFLLHLARYGGTLNAWLVVGASLIIDSTSNSLGVWSNDLMIEVAFVVAISGFRGYLPVRRQRVVRMAQSALRPAIVGRNPLMLMPGPRKMSNLRAD